MPDYELILVGRGSRQPVKTVTCAHDMEALRRAAAWLREGLEVEVREGYFFNDTATTEIYTRKSTDHNLDLEFNLSIGAQIWL
jgi:hypothetical protein